jgi:hypothetical protein
VSDLDIWLSRCSSVADRTRAEGVLAASTTAGTSAAKDNPTNNPTNKATTGTKNRIAGQLRRCMSFLAFL